MDSIFGISFHVLGIMFVLYVIARFLLEISWHRHRSMNDNWFDLILWIVAGLLLVASLPVSAISLHFFKFDFEYGEIKEYEKQRAVFDKMLDGAEKKAYRDGYEKGRKEGYKDGYRDARSQYSPKDS